MEISGKYSLLSSGIMFFIISHGAWLWEGSVTMLEVGKFVNRGFLHGFWLPLYGMGSLFLIYLFGKKKQSFWKIFIGSAVLCTMIEYSTAVLLEKLFHQKWWDYGFIGFDLKGRICGPAILLFGLAGYFLVCLLAPYLDRQIGKMSLLWQKRLCIILALLLLFDFGISVFYPNTGYGITF